MCVQSIDSSYIILKNEKFKGLKLALFHIDVLFVRELFLKNEHPFD